MKKILVEFVSVTLFLICVSIVFHVKFSLLFDGKIIFLVISGTALLSLISIKKNMKKSEMGQVIGMNAMVASLLITFVLFMRETTIEQDGNPLEYLILNGCRPLLYGAVLYIMMHTYNREKLRIEEKDIQNNVISEKLENTEQSKMIMQSEQLRKPNDVKLDIDSYFQKRGMTKREIQIAKLAMKNLSNAEIGEELFIAETTVKKHMSHIFEKLEISSRSELKSK